MSRVVIDGDACTGNGRCYTLGPDLFTDDESGYGQVLDSGPLDDTRLELARRAAAACPEDAIRIVE